jgi:hypothetical protein
MSAGFIAVILACALAAGCGSSPSDPGTSGQTPSLLSPADGSTVTGPQVDFTWDAVTGATRYYHQVSSSPDMADPKETVVSNPHAVVSPGSPGKWWWRVRASVTGQSSYTPWSSVWTFDLI